MKSLVNYLGCGNTYFTKGRMAVDFKISKIQDLTDKIIPFFDKYSLVGDKLKNFEDFKKVSDLMIQKSHLTKEGLDKILTIKSNMNFNRK